MNDNTTGGLDATGKTALPRLPFFLQALILLLSGILLFSAGSKLSGFTASVLEVKHLTRFIVSLPDTVNRVLTVGLIAVEFLLGLALLARKKTTFVSTVSLLLSLLFLGVNLFRMLFDTEENCGCFGEILPITTYYSFLIDLVMVLGFAYLISHTKELSKQTGRNTE